MKWNRKLLNLLPGFSKKPKKPESKTHPVSQPAAAPDKPDSQPAKPAGPPAPENIKPAAAPSTRGFGFARDGVITKPQKMLDEVCAFLARYLQCSEDQRTVLALWVLHTWCFAAARSTPYLAIQSAQKLSGKTLCLRLLSLLCPNPALTSGYTASALVNRIHTHPNELPTFLLDQSPATVGSRSRSKNPKLRAILVSGFQPGIGYSDRSVECTIFSPKAFASTGPLPEPLADCSIPIILQPLNARVAQPPGPPTRAAVARDGVEVPSAVSSLIDQIERFDLATAQQEARSLIAALQNWSNKNLSSLKSIRAYKRKDFPARLTARGQDIVEPLLQLADAVGGDYPARARRALVVVFDDVEKQRQAIVNQLLRDIRQIFQHHNWPRALRTPVLVSDLRALPSRPWDVDGPITDRGLARMLWPLKIAPQVFRKPKSQDDPTSTARGYVQAAFVTLWNDLLDKAGKTPEPKESSTQPGTSTARVAQPPGPPTRAAVARDGVEVPSAVSSVSPAATSNVPSSVSSQPKTATTMKQEIPNKDAGCYAVTEPRIDPRIKGILDDPRNFHRQYPDQHQPQIRNLLLGPRYLWPQPADDQMPPDEVYTLSGGIQMPFTVVNRYPEKPPRSYNRFQSERWPVMLTDNEKLQVAVARFYEIYNAAVAERERKQNESAQDRQEVSAAVS